VRRVEKSPSITEHGIKTETESAKLYNHLGNALQADDQIEQAITSSRTAPRINPDFLLAHNNPGDAFIHVGGLNSIFKAIANALNPDALFAFSLETDGDDAEYKLRTSGPYAHSMTYIRKLAKENNLTEKHLEAATIRMDKNEALKGYIVVLGN